MKTTFAFLGITLFGILHPLRAEVVLQPNDMVAFCGDSITEQKIYTVFLEDYFLMCQPIAGVRMAQMGAGGATLGGYQGKIADEVLPFKPTVVTTCFGMNDGNYAAMTPTTGDTYRKNLTSVIQKLKAGGVRTIIVGSPGCVDGAVFTRPNFTADDYNKTLGALADIARDTAQKEGVGFADVHTPMMKVMAKAKAAYGDNYLYVSGGGIHPSGNAHIVMAYAFLKAFGCDGAIGAITVDLAAGTAEGTPGQKIVSSEKGTIEVESIRYPFCFQGEPGKPAQTEGSTLNFFPFNEELNRYLLVVKGLKGSKAKVTWGSVSREFSAADLAKGINLAAEFLTNPFSGQFAKVHAAVQAQQAHETTLTKVFLVSLSDFKAMAPHSLAELDKVTAEAMARDIHLSDTAKALVIPLHHTIKIESEP